MTIHPSPHLTTLCQTHKVQSLALFGSAVTEKFNPQTSDLDFAVQFEDMPPAAHAEHFFALRQSLIDLFHRSVDLVEIDAVRNPYLRSRIEAQQVVLYGA